MSDETHEETTLVERARGGDDDAYGALVKRYSRDAVRVATAITGSVGDAEDAAQTAFVKAYLALDRFRAGAPVRPWLMRIVANEAKNSRRSSQRRERLAERSHERYCVIAPSAEEGAIAGVTTTELLRAVARLDHRDRSVIAFRFFAEMSEAETALALDCATGTVKSRLSRAMARLRAELDADLPAAGGAR
ncbi:MAG TPA: sigma-70 family RNA polymerase sigma factor [Acidimicrobiales bacterium]|nr:sigma-70 family RNA polymerase sigma factor [Acidimicrobiales bacterium]